MPVMPGRLIALILLAILMSHLGSIEEPHNQIHLDVGGTGTMVRVTVTFSLSMY